LPDFNPKLIRRKFEPVCKFTGAVCLIPARSSDIIVAGGPEKLRERPVIFFVSRLIGCQAAAR